MKHEHWAFKSNDYKKFISKPVSADLETSFLTEKLKKMVVWMSRQKPYLHMFYGIKDFSSNNCVEEKQQENEEKDVTC